MLGVGVVKQAQRSNYCTVITTRLWVCAVQPWRIIASASEGCSEKAASAIASAALKLKSLRRLSGLPYVNRTALSPPFHQPKSTRSEEHTSELQSLRHLV